MYEFKTTDHVTLRFALDDFTDPWEKRPTLVLLHAVMGSHKRARGRPWARLRSRLRVAVI